MSNKHATRKRAVNKKGRNKFSTFVKLEGYVLQSPAYRSLRPAARGIYTELRRRFNGRNNGEISCSIRELAAELHCGTDTIRDGLDDLIAKGFIKRSQKGSFHYKKRHASTWILTEEALGDEPATKEFVRWTPDTKTKPSTEVGTNGTQPGTPVGNNLSCARRRVPKQGPRCRK